MPLFHTVLLKNEHVFVIIQDGEGADISRFSLLSY